MSGPLVPFNQNIVRNGPGLPMLPPESDKVQVRIRNKVGGQSSQIGSMTHTLDE